MNFRNEGREGGRTNMREEGEGFAATGPEGAEKQTKKRPSEKKKGIHGEVKKSRKGEEL